MPEQNNQIEQDPKLRKNIGSQGLAVLNVGNPGNKGGGRPSNYIRQQFREALSDDVIAQLQKDARDPKINVRYAAINTLAKYGIAQSMEIVGVDAQALINRIMTRLSEQLTPEEYERVAPIIVSCAE